MSGNWNWQGLAEGRMEFSYLIDKISEFCKLTKFAYIKKIKEDGKTKYEVKSESNPDWSGGKYDTKEEAEDRLRQVEFFKHNK